MNNIEKELNKRLANIKPSKRLFENTISVSVTKEEDYRYNTKRAGVLSFYQLINNFFMKKSILIGAPIVAIAIVAIVFITKSPSGAPQVANEYSSTQQVGDNILVKEKIIEDNSSIDSILASFDKDAESDVLNAKKESEDIISIMAELEDINNLKTNSYEDSI